MEPQSWEVWLYGMLIITAISVVSLIGLATIPCLNTTSRARWMQVFIALAVSTLCCDAMLHLIPEALGLHDHSHEHSDNTTNHTNQTHDSHEEGGEHEEHGDGESKQYMWLMSFVMLFVYLSYTMEFVSRWAFTMNGHGHSHNIATKVKPQTEPEIQNGWQKEKAKKLEKTRRQSSIMDEQVDTFDEQNELCLGMKPVAWLIMVGDAIHNFADGLIVGVAIRADLISGLKTAVAVMCHEVPHEIGDFVVLIDSGLKIKRAIILNLIGSVTAYIGFCVGVTLAIYISWFDKWVFAAAAGVFLYVAWIDMLHHLKEYDNDHDHWALKLLLQNIGFLLGYTVIFLIGYYEHLISES